MDIKLSTKELEIFKTIGGVADRLHMRCYLIGGFVRDKILDRPTKDADLVCAGDALVLAKAAAEKMEPPPTVSYFKNFGTAHFKISDGFDLEFVGARIESYQAHSRNPDVQPGTIADDQNRRDFTINTLSISLNSEDFGTLTDPFNGRDDLKQQLIKTPLDPAKTFSDDPLRMMRAIRFAAQLHFHIHPATFNAIKENKDRIKIISQERITDELTKIIRTEKPSTGFKLLSDAGLLNLIFPQMTALSGAEYIDGIGHKDNFYHTLQVLDNVARHTDNIWLRWAAILHDIGKPAAKRFEEPYGWTFHGHEVIGGRMVPKIFNSLKLPLGDNMKYVQKLVELHMRPISLTKEDITDSAIRRLLFDAEAYFDDLMLLCQSDITSKNKLKVKRYVENFEAVKKRCQEVEEKDSIRNWQPPITGEVIMKTFGIPPSRKVGDIKTAIKDAILDGLIANSYEAAYQFMLQKGEEYKLQPLK